MHGRFYIKKSFVYLANYECHYSASIIRLLVAGNMRLKHVQVTQRTFVPLLALQQGHSLSVTVYLKKIATRDSKHVSCCRLQSIHVLLYCRSKSGQLTSHYATKISHCVSNYLTPDVFFAWSDSSEGIIRQLVTAVLVLITLYRLPLNPSTLYSGNTNVSLNNTFFFTI